MTKTIAITGGKGGVGKTSICVNAALEIARRNFRACILDADPGLTNVDAFLGLQPEKTLDDFISGDKRLDEIVRRSTTGIDIIPGSSDSELIANLGKDKISDLIASFSQLTDYDYFLIDASSGISKGVISFCLASSETIIVITSETTSLTEAYALLRVMSSNDYRGTVQIVVNKCESVPLSRRTYQRFKTVVDKHLNIEIAPAGIVLNDANINRAIEQQKPLLSLYPNSIGSQCIRTMVSALLENDTRENSPTDLGKFWALYFNFAQSDLSFGDKRPDPSTSQSPPSSMEHSDAGFYTPVSSNKKQQSLKKDPAITNHQPGLIIPFSHTNGIIDPLNLPSPTTLLAKSLKLQAQGELSEKALLKIYSCDPALMVRAMQLFCNHKGIDSNRVTKIDQIVEELGLEVLSNLIISTSMRKALSDATIHDTFCVNKFWYHSYKSALLAELIAKTIDYAHPEEAFLAGLIHDIGRLALQTDYPGGYKQFPATFHHEEILIETETRIFARTHAKIGATSLTAWNFNNYIVDAARYHCESEARIKTGFDLVKIIFLACRMTQPVQRDTEELFRLGDSLFSLSPAQLLGCVETADQEISQIADHFDIPLAEIVKENKDIETDTHFKREAVNYSILQSALPTSAPVQNLPQVIRQIHNGLDILFGVKPTICLMVNSNESSLQAVGYPDCFAWKILSDITLSLQSEKSLIVESFTTNTIKTSLDHETDSLQSLADEQIIRILDSHGLVCVPMTSQGVTWGVIVFGIQKEEYSNVQNTFSRLETFGSQSAKNISASAQL